ncbi:MAG TPA: glucoamylase family protein, partial [Planctomycetaceae bacterium]|nr:glucoamylase family protein [Planctomycetaceae bacterium]
ILLLWLAGPAIAWKLSQPRRSDEAALTESQRQRLRAYARRTWHYYETFVTERENWLAPDNFQEFPAPVVAPRTSPTNIGMGLIAPLAAWDFGYVSTKGMADQIARTLTTLDALDRYRGHFYNWYDTRTLLPLHPSYVSSVDSGNLAALLLTLQAGLEQTLAAPIVRAAWFEGLADTLRMALEAGIVSHEDTPLDHSRSLPREIVLRIERLLAQCRVPPDGLRGAHRVLDHLGSSAVDIATAASGFCDGRVSVWITAFSRQSRDFHEELLQLAPWAAVDIPQSPGGSHPAFETLEKARGLLEKLNEPPPLNEIPARAGQILAAIEAFAPTQRLIGQNGHVAEPGQITADLPAESLSEWRDLAARIEQGGRAASQLTESLESCGSRCGAFAEMDFRFLYDPRRELLAIGFNVSDRRMDQSYYDLLASESRLASFLAIAQGQLPQDHWFALGRMVTTQDGEPTLLSWSGSMFEYLMPMLLMPNYEGTLLDLAVRGAVARQIEYGRQNRVPWGVSESCYNVTDAQFTYQYRAFGVPGLGLQRGLGEDLVIAPYASVMALLVAPQASAANLERMEAAGWLGEYGFFDAVDHTPARSGPDQSPVPCRTYMAHHSGMSLLALDSVLHDQPMQKRFLANPLFKAHDLMLQERVPGAIRPVYPHPAEMRDAHVAGPDVGPEETATRYFNTADTPTPEVHLLGNGQYHVIVSNSGSGLSSWNGLSLTRWHADFTQDR